jgi:hypothetical protein
MAEAESVRQSSAAQTAAALAPEAFAHAEKLRRDAEAAYQSGDLSGAQMLAERALAAYQHELVLARIARASETANRATLALRASEQSLAQSDGEQRRVSAQADDLEMRIKVIKDANPIVSAGPTDGAREIARLSAARSLGLDARLLCAAARMLAPETPSLAAAQQVVADLDKRLSTQPRPAPIEAAMRARAQCLAVLTAARRPAGNTSSLGKSDQLLSELSAVGGLSPVRDDRGVVVTLRKIFAADQLSKEGREQVEALGRVAQAHAEFPLQVVVHAAGSKSGAGAGKGPALPDRQRGETIAKVLSDAGAASDRILVEAAGTAHPAIDPTIASDPGRNERIEIIFVDPGG